jgi:hypothetical protein
MRVTETHVGRVLVGAGALVVICGAVQWWHGERVVARMRTTTCTLLVKEVESRLMVDLGPRGGRGDFTRKRARLYYRDEARVVFAHTVNGGKYTFEEAFIGDSGADYEEGKAYPCRYDPQDPRRATVATIFNCDEMDDVLLMGGSLMVLGAVIPKIWRDSVAWSDRRRGR